MVSAGIKREGTARLELHKGLAGVLQEPVWRENTAETCNVCMRVTAQHGQMRQLLQRGHRAHAVPNRAVPSTGRAWIGKSFVIRNTAGACASGGPRGQPCPPAPLLSARGPAVPGLARPSHQTGKERREPQGHRRGLSLGRPQPRGPGRDSAGSREWADQPAGPADLPRLCSRGGVTGACVRF